MRTPYALTVCQVFKCLYKESQQGRTACRIRSESGAMHFSLSWLTENQSPILKADPSKASVQL